MQTFNDLEFKQHPFTPEGKHAKVTFPNGYGVSVIQGSMFYCGPETYELAVLKGGKITYDTDVTDDVLGYQTPEDVTAVMTALQKMEA